MNHLVRAKENINFPCWISRKINILIFSGKTWYLSYLFHIGTNFAPNQNVSSHLWACWKINQRFLLQFYAILGIHIRYYKSLNDFSISISFCFSTCLTYLVWHVRLFPSVRKCGVAQLLYPKINFYSWLL